MSEKERLSDRISKLENELEYLKRQSKMIEDFQLQGDMELKSYLHFTTIYVGADDFKKDALKIKEANIKERIADIKDKLAEVHLAIQ